MGEVKDLWEWEGSTIAWFIFEELRQVNAR